MRTSPACPLVLLLCAARCAPTATNADAAREGSVDDAGAVDATTPVSRDASDEATPDARRRDAAVCPPALPTAVPRTGPAPTPGPMDALLRMNHLQVVGTHNSYHVAPPNPSDDWNYTHAPLLEQLEHQRVRKLELDLNWNASCQRFEVFHIPQFDEGTRCRVFTDCLAIVRAWSDAHPGHAPLFIQLEPKGGVIAADAPARCDAIDREIRAVFPDALLVTPDLVQGDATTLRDAVTTRGWPTLGAVRGRVLFFIDRDDLLRDAYTHDGRDLRGRAAFIDSDPTHPYAAVRFLNDPIGDAREIEQSVRAGYLVRTMTDPSLTLIRANDRTRADAALASGAHILSTDYPVPVATMPYSVSLPGTAPVRCNPLIAPMGCASEAIESLGH